MKNNTNNNVTENGNIVILSPSKVAEILEVKESFVKQLLREGKLKGFKMGKFWRITEAELNAYYVNCSKNGNGTSRVSEDTRNKIRFHVSLRSQDKTINKVGSMEEDIEKIKRDVRAQYGYKKVASIIKLKSNVVTREDKQRKLDTMDDYLGDLVSKTYPDIIDLTEKDPDTLEELFKEAAKEPKKSMVEYLDKRALEDMGKSKIEGPQEEENLEVMRVDAA